LHWPPCHRITVLPALHASPSSPDEAAVPPLVYHPKLLHDVELPGRLIQAFAAPGSQSAVTAPEAPDPSTQEQERSGEEMLISFGCV